MRGVIAVLVFLTWVQVSEFYFVRYGLALVCALCQTIMFQVTSSTINGRIGLFFLIATVTSPGNFHASTAYLPSSFAMYMCLLGASAFMNWRGGLKTAQGIFWFAMAGVLGWPFAAALCAPYVLEELILMVFSDTNAKFEAAIRIGRGIVAGIVLLVRFREICTCCAKANLYTRQLTLLSTCSSTKRQRL